MNENLPIYSDDQVYDNLFGIKLKGLFNKENREARKQSRDDRKANRQANQSTRSEGGSGFKNILSGLGSIVKSGSGLSSNINPTGMPITIMQGPALVDPNASKKYTPYYIAGGILAVIIIIVIIIFATRK